MKRRDFLKSFAAASALVIAGPVLAKVSAFVPSTPEVVQSIPTEQLESQGYAELEQDLLDAYNDYLDIYPEVNDDFTQKLLQLQMDDVLMRYQQQRKLVGYRVICDETNNPKSVVDANDIVVTIQYHKTRDPYARTITLSKDQ